MSSNWPEPFEPLGKEEVKPLGNQQILGQRTKTGSWLSDGWIYITLACSIGGAMVLILEIMPAATIRSRGNWLAAIVWIIAANADVLNSCTKGRTKRQRALLLTAATIAFFNAIFYLTLSA